MSCSTYTASSTAMPTGEHAWVKSCRIAVRKQQQLSEQVVISSIARQHACMLGSPQVATAAPCRKQHMVHGLVSTLHITQVLARILQKSQPPVHAQHYRMIRLLRRTMMPLPPCSLLQPLCCWALAAACLTLAAVPAVQGVSAVHRQPGALWVSQPL